MTAVSAPRTDAHRPAHHLTPSSTWMNDPNGLIRHDGLWHAFFQNNPYGSLWGHLSWGHATSPDLASWTEQPVAIEATAEGMIFSGSVVHDAHNTSGLCADGDGPLVAIFTSAFTDAHPTRAGIQAQSLASSTDGGLTWTRYAGNPVLDRDSANFRDPKVFWHEETGRWVMVAVEALDHTLHVHTSADLITWEHASEFTDPRVDGGIWECPDLLRVPVDGADGGEAWVLILSTNPGGPAGGSGTYGIVGSFDGTAFTAGADPVPLDLGPDAYATVSFSGVEGTPVLLGWMNNWDYATTTPTDPWRSSMTLPRTLHLARGEDGALVLRQHLVVPESVPTLELEVPSASDEPVELARLDGGSPFRLRGALPRGRALDLVLRFATEDGPREVVVALDADGAVTVDRSRAHLTGFAPEHARSAPWPAAEFTEVPFELVMDRSCLELELDGGLALVSQQIFPGGGEVTVLAVPRS